MIFQGFLHYLVLVELASSSVRVKQCLMDLACRTFLSLCRTLVRQLDTPVIGPNCEKSHNSPMKEMVNILV